jgi:TRAP-type uncharacterized transport system substrate-binding protein
MWLLGQLIKKYSDPVTLMIHQNANMCNRWQEIKGKRFEFTPFCSDEGTILFDPN